MKTTILLDLSRTSVRLLEGGGEAATVLGEVALDDPDFESRIADLRQQAGGGGEVIVLIPHSEILFFDLDPAGGGDAAEKAAIRDALEGRTPYALADLAFDWRRRKDGRIGVAAVARETLDEAEAFAAAQGFAPTGYGSLTEPSVFGGRADFGRRGAVKFAARPVPPAPAAVKSPLPHDAPDTRPDSPAKDASARASATPAPRDKTAAKAGPQSPVPMRRAAERPNRAAILPPDLGTLPRPMAEDRAARLSLPKRPDEAEAATGSGAPPTPSPRHPAKAPIRPVATGLAAALALAALLTGGVLLLGPGDGGMPFERVAAVSDTRDAPAEDKIAARTASPEAPAEAAVAEGGGASEPAAPERSPDDPSNRAANATGAEATPPAAPQPPAISRADGPDGSAADAELALPTGAVTLAGPLDELPLPQAAAPAAAEPEAEAEPEDQNREDTSPTASDTAAPTVEAAAAPEATDPAESGAPVLRPATRPDTANRAEAQPATDASRRAAPQARETDTEAPGALVERADRTLRPRARPGAADLGAPAELTVTDEAAIADLAPRPRPEDAAPDATTEPVPAVVDSAAVAAAAASALDEALPEEPPSPYAVARSLSPQTRPQDFPREEAATAASVVTPRTPIEPAAAEGPTIPERLSPGRVNLIGVYGSSSNRRALVRLPSGRFAKVKVGDPVDGGRVRAIGDADLSYVKSGRSVTLQMPGG